MSRLSGDDIERLARSLTKTLSLDDLEIFVHASTGDQLFDEYAGPGKTKHATIFELLNKLEDVGSTALFLRYVFLRRPGRPDVQQLIAQLCPDAAKTIFD